MQVINIRGTTSSGKTTAMTGLIKASNQKNRIITLTPEVKGTLISFGIVIGTYKKGSKFGGCDAIKKIEYMEQAIWKALEIRPIVFFEGLLVSHSYERWKNFSDKLKTIQKEYNVKQNGIIWVFTSPSFRQNLNQLKKRNNIKNLRKKRGDKFVMNFIQRYKSIVRLKKKAIKDKMTIENIDSKDIFKLMKVVEKYKDQVLLKGKDKKGITKFL